MINLITEIIESVGPRPAGSEAERKAQLLVADKCKEFTPKVLVLEFEEYLHARFGKLKYYSLLFYIALLLYYFDQPIIALVVSLLNAVAFVLDFMTYRVILQSFPGKLGKSWNVEATLEPQGEVKNTLVFSGHIDSVYEFKWWYKLGQQGAQLTVIGGAIMVLFPLFCLLTILISGGWSFYVFLAFVLLSPSLVAYFNMHGEEPVDGACDNLSGVAIAFDVVKHFADPKNHGKSTLKNTRLKFVSFGSEETGLTGSCAYVKVQKDELLKEKAHLVNIDSIRLPEEVCIIKGETMNGTTYDKNLIARLQKSFGDKNIPIKTGSTPIGGTDGVFFIRAGIPAVSMIGLGMDKLDPTYHTRRDVIANLNPEALENVKSGLIEFVEQWDGK
ncbi:MAG TPA: M28 family peptidase [Chitinophagales bacterium]|nr:M28 family peptidase [Chitinophagales bacterium]